MNWYTKSYKDVAESLDSDIVYGLGSKQVTERHSYHGKNKLEEKKRTSIIVRFFMQLNDFMIIVLLSAAAVSFFISFIEGEKDFVDPIIILMIVALNAVLGLVQESKAEKALEALKEMTIPHCKVIRDGKRSEIFTEDLVPGDLIVLETGDLVPADARLVMSANLKVEESALTGESLPVEKDADLIIKNETGIGDRRNMVFLGSSISYGRGMALVTHTGMSTEVGKIAHMILTDESPETPLQKKLAQTGKFLGTSALVICLIIFIIGLFRQIPPFTMFMTSVGLAVAAIPEGLPAIVTIMLAIGVQRMAKKNAVIRKLPAVETLGSANVICSDKTGTLTQNKMKIVEVCDGFGILGNLDTKKDYILKLGTLCNDAVLNEDNKIVGEPTEMAFVVEALNLKMNKNTLEKENPRIGEVPFDSKRKLMSTVHKTKENTYLSITKGAPDVLLDKCNYYHEQGKKIKLTAGKRKEISELNMKMASKALRVLGVAYKEYGDRPYKINSGIVEKDLVFVGLAGMIDPPRPEVKEAVQTCKKAGIKPVMVTGDHVLTACAIGRKLGIMEFNDKAMTGEELNLLTQEELTAKINNYSVFARVSPEHKVRIVKAFQATGAVVAMTGDGVNDAPALKVADIGCAMGVSGTDVAKGAADMVLTDDNFATIVHAVREGRGIYANIKKAVHFLLSSNIGEILTILSAILLGWDSPLLAIHLLWVNLVTDSLPAIALGLDPSRESVMEEKPYSNDKGLFSDGMWQKICFEGCMVGMLALLAFAIGTVFYDTNGGHAIGRTMAFATLSISQLVHAFNMRSEESIFNLNLFENIYLVWAFIMGTLLQVSVIMIPALSKIFKVVSLSSYQWIIVAILCISPIIIVELEKFASSRQEKPNLKTESI